MRYDFDQRVDRFGTHSLKWDKYQKTDILPMWVADMDFKAPPEIIKALEQTVSHGVFGYTNVPDSLQRAVVSRLKRLYGWQIDSEAIVWTPGVVSALNGVCAVFGSSKETVVTTVPIYPPFLSVSDHCGKKLVTLPMKKTGGRSTLDFKKIEAAFSKGAAVFMLCSPYNPCGTLFTRKELVRLTDLCEQYDVVLCSDEIHSDFVLDPENTHIPVASISRSAGNRTLTLMAPSKTFNVPGLGCSFVVVENPDLRKKFKASIKGIVPDVNIMGLAAAKAAYESCDEWLSQLISYLRKNRNLVVERVNRMPGCKVNPIPATYLAWIDVRGTGLEDPVGFFESAGVGLSDGKFFDQKGFVRLNFGCPNAVLAQGLDRMEAALKTL